MRCRVADEAKKETPGVSIETYQRPDGWWSFRVNGRESHYRSSNEAGLQRTVKALLFGPPAGVVKLKAVASKSGTATTPPTTESDPGSAWADLPTQAERVAAFLRRGKLAAEKQS